MNKWVCQGTALGAIRLYYLSLDGSIVRKSIGNIKMETLSNRTEMLKQLWLILLLTICVTTESNSQERSFISNSRLLLGSETNLSASVRVGDLDGDGRNDAVIANGRHWPQQNFLIFNQGRARMNLMRRLGTDLATTYATEVADLDGDGDLDIAVGNDFAPSLIMLNDGTGNFSKHTEFGELSSVRSLTLGDLDQDGDVDIVATSRKMQNYVYLNDGKANFETRIPFGDANDSTIDIAIGDVNNDGHPDLALANRDGQQNFVLVNNGMTKFNQRIEFGTGKDETRAVALADMNNDGHLDLISANIRQSNSIYFNDKNGGFANSIEFGDATESTYSLCVSDMNNDGKLDIVAGNQGQENAVYMNRGVDLGFQTVPFGNADAATYGLDVGDFDGDGFNDVVVANSEEKNFLFLNRPPRQRKR